MINNVQIYQTFAIFISSCTYLFNFKYYNHIKSIFDFINITNTNKKINAQ